MTEHEMSTIPSTMPSTIPKRPIHLPAWKKIGLKLKLPQVQSYALGTVSTEDITLKRKAALLGCGDEKDKKMMKMSPDITYQKAHETPPNFSAKKSVKFTPETKAEDGDSIKKLLNTWISQHKSIPSPNLLFKSHEVLDTSQEESPLSEGKRKKPRKTKRKKSDSAVISENSKTVLSAATKAIPPFLSYLRAYHESRETWKFKKNHQTHLLQYVFDIKVVPSDHAHLIYGYIRGLKGQVRTRLRDTAIAVKVEDQEGGVAGFPMDMPNRDQRQQEYESAVADYVATHTTSHIRQDGHEEKFVSRFQDDLMNSRVIKRIRAEMILNELASSPDENGKISQEIRKDEILHAQLKNNPSQKKVRRRKQRTINLEESSSDESESDNDNPVEDEKGSSESSSSSSSVCSMSSSDSDSDSDSDTE